MYFLTCTLVSDRAFKQKEVEDSTGRAPSDNTAKPETERRGAYLQSFVSLSAFSGVSILGLFLHLSSIVFREIRSLLTPPILHNLYTQR